MSIISPVEALERLKEDNRPAYVLLWTGIGLFAAAAIAGAIQMSTGGLASSIVVGLCLLVSALLVYACVTIVTDHRLRAVFSSFVCALVMIGLVAAAVSIVWRGGPIPPIGCWLSPTPECSGDVEAAQAPDPIPIPDAQTTDAGLDPTVVPAAYHVVIQFAGLIKREAVIELAQRLDQAGWSLDADTVARGGERTEVAAGFSEVRHAAADKLAAEALARQIEAANVSGHDVEAIQSGLIRPGQLEVWISR